MAMTNTERIQANNAELREAIEMAETLPDAGGGGSGGYETCTIKVVCGRGVESFRLLEYALTCVNNGEIQANAATVYESGKTEVVFENVLCGSGAFIYFEESSGMTSTTVSNNMTTFDDFYLFAAPTQSGAIGVITVNTDAA